MRLLVDYLTFDAKIFKNRMFRVQFWAIRIFGCIVCSDDRFKMFHLFRGIFNAIGCALILTGGVILLYTDVDDMEISTMIVASLIVFLNILVKIVYFFINSKVYYDILNTIHDGTDQIDKKDENFTEQFYQTYIRDIKRISITVGSLLMFSSSTSIFEAFSFIVTNREDLTQGDSKANITLPLLYVLIPTRVIWENFVFAYIFPFYLEILGCFGYFAWTTFYTNLLKYAAFRLDVINYKLRNFIELATVDIHEQSSSGYYNHGIARNVFVECVKEVIQLKRLVGKYENIMNVVVFIESMTTTTFLCIIMYQITQFGDSSTLLALAPWTFGQLAILYMYYWNANEIDFKSGQVPTSLYLSRWYELPVSFQKEVLLFMKGCSNPLKIKAIFLNIDMPSFVLILKTSYSYFTLLSNVADKDGH